MYVHAAVIMYFYLPVTESSTEAVVHEVTPIFVLNALKYSVLSWKHAAFNLNFTEVLFY